MSRLWSAFAIGLLLVSAFQLLFPGLAEAHERRSVSKYQLVVGFIVEPPFEGQKNGVDLRVTSMDTKKPVEGLEKTVQVEITHVPSNTVKTFAIRAIFNDPGHYTNDLLLTAPGQYKFRFFGNIEGTPLNETFTSGPGTFNDVGSSVDIQFPQQLPQMREVVASVQGAQNIATDARLQATIADSQSSSGRTLGAIGIGLGVVGIALGVRPFVVASKKQRSPNKA